MKIKQELYLIKLGQTELYKIGVSKNAKKRLKQLQTGCPYTLSIIKVYHTLQPYKVEKTLHSGMSSKKCSPDFLFDFDLLMGEWFALTTEDVLNFEDKCTEIEKRLNFLKEAGNPFV